MTDPTPAIRALDSIYIPREIALMTDLRAFAQLYSLMRAEEYDVVHTYTATPSFLGRIVARLTSVPVIVNHQGGWSINEQSSLFERLLYRPLEYMAILASTRNICVGHAEANLARELRIAPLHKLVTIVNGMDPEPFVRATEGEAAHRIRQELGIANDCFIIGCTSRLVPGKGNEVLLEAIALLKKQLADRPFILLLAGDGRDRAALEQMASTLGIDTNVRFLGFLDDIPSFLASVDIFVTATFFEGPSIALLEAMAAACPIVATSIPPNAEVVVHNQTGLLVPVDSASDIVNAVEQLARDPGFAQRLGQAARTRVLEHYTLERMFRETWSLYLDLLSTNSAHRAKEGTAVVAEK